MLKKLREHHIFLVFLSPILYFTIGIISSKSISNSVSATIVADTIIILMLFKLIPKHKPVEEKLSSPPLGLFYSMIASSFMIDFWYNANLVDKSLQSYQSSMADASVFCVLILTLIIAPVSEEILFRGIIYGHLAEKINPYVAVLISSFLFGIIHGTGVHIIIGTFMGCFFCYIFESTGSVKYSIIYHFAYNALSLYFSCAGIVLNIPKIWMICMIAGAAFVWLIDDYGYVISITRKFAIDNDINSTVKN